MKTITSAVGRIGRNGFLVVGLAIIVLYVFIGLLTPVLAPPASDTEPYKIPRDLELYQLTNIPTLPSSTHFFGTTDQQYDIYYGCIWGTRMAFRIGILVMLSALAIGLPLGTLAGYFGGFVDDALSWIINIFLVLSPILTLMMIIALPSELSTGLSTLVLSRTDKLVVALILFGWPIFADTIRRGVFRIREHTQSRFEQPTATKVNGWGAWREFSVLVLHVASLQLAITTLFAAGISFLGLGSYSDSADWGNLIAGTHVFLSRSNLLLQYWHLYFFPGIFLIGFVLGWILLGEGFTITFANIVDEDKEKAKTNSSETSGVVSPPPS